MPHPNIAGFDKGKDNSTYSGAPGLPFLMGVQDKNFIRQAASNGWLTKDPAFNEPFTMSKTELFNIKGTFEPFRGFRVELSGTRSYSKFNSQYFHYSDSVTADGGFYFDKQLVNGGFSISIITIGTAFEKLKSDNGFQSANFERFKRYRTIISGRLSNERERKSAYPFPDNSLTHELEEGYSYGYGSTSPEVLMPAFIAAYTGRDPHKQSLETFPGILSILPNWTFTFDGLPKIEAVSRLLKTATLRHSYKSVYNINSFATNFRYEEDELDGLGYIKDIQENFVPELLMNTVSIREDLNPLIGFDGTWVNNLITRFEYRKSRFLALALANNQLTESMNNEFIIGAGYRFNKVPLKIGEKAYESDLNVRFDLSVRDNKTIVRYLAQTDDDESDQITSGDRIFKIEFTADYLLSPRFNLRFFFDRTLNKPHTSRSFLRVDTNIGFSLRFTLSQ
jgi:cell surface protein SprA